MNYTLITDEEKLEEFVNFLPKLKANEKYMIFLFARKKYDPTKSIKNDKAQLKRVLADKNRIIEKIRQLEISIGGYKVDGENVPQEALALYITPNPRCLKRASKTLAKRLVEAICENTDVNPVSEALTAVHQSLGNNVFKDFDFDSVELDETLPEILKVVNESAVHIIFTRGGFHILIEMPKIEDQYKKTWYQGISNLKGCDVRGDNLIPIVGCTQGMFTPHFFKTKI